MAFIKRAKAFFLSVDSLSFLAAPLLRKSRQVRPQRSNGVDFFRGGDGRSG
jgi:hypothetical protein